MIKQWIQWDISILRLTSHQETKFRCFCLSGYGSIPIIPFLGGWTSIYQLFWCSPGVQGFDTLPSFFHRITNPNDPNHNSLPDSAAPPLSFQVIVVAPVIAPQRRFCSDQLQLLVGSLNVPMGHITQPWMVYGQCHGYFFRWCPLYSQNGTVTNQPLSKYWEFFLDEKSLSLAVHQTIAPTAIAF